MKSSVVQSGFLFRYDTDHGSKISIKSEHRRGNSALTIEAVNGTKVKNTSMHVMFLLGRAVIFCKQLFAL